MNRTDVQIDRLPKPVATEGALMLHDLFVPRLSEFDESVYAQVVPPDHFLRKVLRVVPWDDFFAQVAPYYSADLGRPPEPPVLMLKLEYLRYHHHLSDREVIARAQTDLAFRWFLQLPLRWKLPDPSSLCVFRGRLGRKGFQQVFDQVVRTAREHGVVRDRLRIKDATHVIGNLAVPTALALVAQTRDKLLAAAEPFAPLLVEGEQVNLQLLREATQQQKPAERLVTRLAQLREMLVWADAVTAPEDAETNRAWQTFLTQRDLAHKILEDQEHPGAGDRTLSTSDPEARCGKHGAWFDGYLVDLLIDADSEIITQVNVLPANGDEAADAVELIRQEEQAHGHDVQALSIDGAGFNGPLLRELQDPEGLNIDTYVPVPEETPSGLFTPQNFQEDPARGVVTCPAGQTSTQRYHDRPKQTTTYRFEAAVCRACPLLAPCMKQAPRPHGRTVSKSDFQAEHQRARHKATTPQYTAVRREHPKVERKLGEVMNRHGGRRARYRGRWKVLIQELMACTATNVKRLVRLGCAPEAAVSCAR
jgi:IS5 family transposase